MFWAGRQLRKMPAKYIYEPWKAPRNVQEEAGCVVGRDYPRPIVDHGDISKRNMERMKHAYATLNGSSGRRMFARPAERRNKQGSERVVT